MNKPFFSQITLPEFPLWEKAGNKRNLIAFDLEITARCNNNCRHCYINLPEDDLEAKKKELSLGQIKNIVDQAYSLGALWCLITGGEPLLREDFFEIYLYLKKKGFLISIFTNATLITKRHIAFFKKYPPRDIEVTVYGVNKDTYDRIARKSGSFKAFMAGLNLLLEGGIRVRFKTMALRSNVQELLEIARFCRKRTKDYFKFDPFLHLRYDVNSKRNAEIRQERLSAEEIIKIEQEDSERLAALEKNCDRLIFSESEHSQCNHLFHCGAGNGSFSVSYDGHFHPCSSLWHLDCLYDLKIYPLKEAWENFTPKVRDMRSNRKEFLEKCCRCSIINLCLWCPAHAYLETGQLDEPVDYFCDVAHARAAALEKAKHRPPD